MRIIKLIMYVFLSIFLYNFCFYEVLFIADWYCFDGLYIYWLIIPVQSIVIMYTIHLCFFKHVKMGWFVIAFAINFVLMSSYAYVKQINTPPDDFFINIVFPIYFISSFVAFLVSIFIAILSNKRRNYLVINDDELDGDAMYSLGSRPKHLTFKKNFQNIIIMVFIFHFFFYTTIYTTSTLISYNFSAPIIAPIVVTILMIILESRYKKYWASRNTIIALAFCTLMWGTILTLKSKWFINQEIEQTTIAAGVTLVLMAVYEILKWIKI